MKMNNQKTKDKLIKLLEENSNLLRACKLTGVARATVYRWLKLDPEFANRVELAQEVGRDSMVDFAEAKLFENMKNNHQRALEYFLSHNSTRYANNAVQERHGAHRNVGRIAKLREGTDTVYLYPQTELIDSIAYYQKLNDQAGRLKTLLNTIQSGEPVDIKAIDPMLEALFLHFFPEMKEKLEKEQMEHLERAIEAELERRIALKHE
tara:strand:- start:6300 stop:6923 length:624 start_codon:yes stop_codon:yes gene_type:complete